MGKSKQHVARRLVPEQPPAKVQAAADNNVPPKPPKGKAAKSKFGYDYSKDYADPNWPYHKGHMDKGAWFLIVAFPTFVVTMIFYVWYGAQMREMVHQPLDVPLIVGPSSPVTNLSSHALQQDPERFWGSYRSGLYFGFKTRSPQSPVFGLMWMSQMTGEMPPPVRHWCEQSDKLPMYGWFAHDGVNFGIQEILDQHYTVTTNFVKRPGGLHGGDWSSRIRLTPRPGAEEAVASLFFYAALDGQGRLEAETKKDQLLAIAGSSAQLGDFRLFFPQLEKKAKLNYLVAHAEGLDQLKEAMLRGFRLYQWGHNNLQYLGLAGKMLPRENPHANFIVYQLTVKMPVDLQVLFESGSASDRAVSLKGQEYQKALMKHLGNFDDKFEDVFGLKKKGFDSDHIGFAKATLANMVGSIGYFHGSSLVKSKYVTEEPLEYWAAPLYTAVPSRSFFPRGFLWDEGFHNLLISKWDQRISMDIIGHWLDLMNVEGWIPREQILGVEARAKVPAEFVVQHNENANPPTLFLPLQKIVKDLIASEDPAHKAYLKALYPRLKVWFSWFNTTQGGSGSAYRWRGRNPDTKTELNPKTLTSGLDDYPRASHPTDEERHLDLRCWMALASGVMADIAQSLGEPHQAYKDTHELLTDNKLLDELHWSSKAERYADYGLHTDHVKLERPKQKPSKPGQLPQPPRDKERVTKKSPTLGFVDSNFGYVSLFPLMLKVIQPDNLKLGKVLSDLQDPNLLWTSYGLRSLAKSSPLYNKHNTEHDPPYWRGAIWVNLNYLTIAALHHYSNTAGPYKDTAKTVYTELRENVINNIYRQYRATGYVWEQYEDKTGHGKGSHPFTGWSALVVSIMAEDY